MGAVNTTATMPANLWTYYNKRLLSVLDPTLRFYQLGEKKPLPQGYGKVAYFLRYNKLPISEAQTLAEGTPPTETSLSSVNISAQIAQYGDYIKITDLLDLTAIDNVKNSAVDRLGALAALKIDTVIRDVLDAAGANQYANGNTALSSVGTGDVLTAKEFLKAATALKAADVPARSDGNYVAVIHPACSYDVMNDTNTGSWVDINKYTGTDKAYNGEIGKCYGVRVIESSNISSTTSGTESSATVYSNLVLGSEAFGVIELAGQNLKTFFKSAGSAGTADPLDQVSTVGFKVAFAAVSFGGTSNYDTDRIIRIRAGSASGV